MPYKPYCSVGLTIQGASKFKVPKFQCWDVLFMILRKQIIKGCGALQVFKIILKFEFRITKCFKNLNSFLFSLYI